MSLPSFVGGPMTFTPLVPLIFDSAGKSMIIAIQNVLMSISLTCNQFYLIKFWYFTSCNQVLNHFNIVLLLSVK